MVDDTVFVSNVWSFVSAVQLALMKVSFLNVHYESSKEAETSWN